MSLQLALVTAIVAAEDGFTPGDVHGRPTPEEEAHCATFNNYPDGMSACSTIRPKHQNWWSSHGVKPHPGCYWIGHQKSGNYTTSSVRTKPSWISYEAFNSTMKMFLTEAKTLPTSNVRRVRFEKQVLEDKVGKCVAQDVHECWRHYGDRRGCMKAKTVDWVYGGTKSSTNYGTVTRQGRNNKCRYNRWNNTCTPTKVWKKYLKA